MLGVGAYFLLRGPAAVGGGAGAGAGSRGTRSGTLSALARSVRCSGCPPPPEGPGLVRDVAVARSVLEGTGSVPPGWASVGTPPPARRDVADGKADPAGAGEFVRCMGLGPGAAGDVLRDADQVLNMGGSPLALAATAGGDPQATMSRWVDMVASRQDATRDWEIYASARFGACAGYIFAPRRESSATRGARGSPAGARSALSATSVTRSFLSLPDGARGVVLRPYPYAARDGAGFLIGLATVGRVQASVVLDGAGSERLVSEVLAGMVGRAVAVGVRPGL